MSATDRQARYQATYRKRLAFRAQATLLGWTKLPVLDAFVTDTGELVVIDKDGTRYGTDASQLITPEEIKPLVEPVKVDVQSFAQRWQQGRQKIGQSVANIDLESDSREEALKLFEELAGLALRGVEILRHYDGPDWREQLGLDKVP